MTNVILHKMDVMVFLSHMFKKLSLFQEDVESNFFPLNLHKDVKLHTYEALRLPN